MAQAVPFTVETVTERARIGAGEYERQVYRVEGRPDRDTLWRAVNDAQPYVVCPQCLGSVFTITGTYDDGVSVRCACGREDGVDV